MKAKVIRTKVKPEEGFLGLLTPEEMKKGEARFLAEINSKEIRLRLLKEKNT